MKYSLVLILFVSFSLSGLYGQDVVELLKQYQERVSKWGGHIVPNGYTKPKSTVGTSQEAVDPEIAIEPLQG